MFKSWSVNFLLWPFLKRITVREDGMVRAKADLRDPRIFLKSMYTFKNCFIAIFVFYFKTRSPLYDTCDWLIDWLIDWMISFYCRTGSISAIHLTRWTLWTLEGFIMAIKDLNARVLILEESSSIVILPSLVKSAQSKKPSPRKQKSVHSFFSW